MTPKRIAPGFCQKASPSAALMVPQPAQNLLTAKILPALGGPIPSFLPDTPPNRPNGDRTESPATPKPARRKTRFCRKPPGGGERLEKTPASPSARRRHIAGFPLPPPPRSLRPFPWAGGTPPGSPTTTSRFRRCPHPQRQPCRGTDPPSPARTHSAIAAALRGAGGGGDDDVSRGSACGARPLGPQRRGREPRPIGSRRESRPPAHGPMVAAPRPLKGAAEGRKTASPARTRRSGLPHRCPRTGRGQQVREGPSPHLQHPNGFPGRYRCCPSGVNAPTPPARPEVCQKASTARCGRESFLSFNYGGFVALK